MNTNVLGSQGVPANSGEPSLQVQLFKTVELTQEFFFEAAHTLQRIVAADSSRRIHGHTYEAAITVSGDPDSVSGMLIDLSFLQTEIARIKDLLDHRFLDEVEGLGAATLENLCMFIMRELSLSLPSLHSVMVGRQASGNRCVLRRQSP